MIQHGIPKHPFFCIVQPANKEQRGKLINTKMQDDWKNPVLDFEDPVSKQKFKAELFDMWHFPVNEMPGMFTLLSYGIDAEKLKQVLLKRYPQLRKPNSEVEYWLLKKI